MNPPQAWPPAPPMDACAAVSPWHSAPCLNPHAEGNNPFLPFERAIEHVQLPRKTLSQRCTINLQETNTR